MKKNMTSMVCLLALLTAGFFGISQNLKADEKEVLCPACQVAATSFSDSKYNVGKNPVKKMECSECKTSFDAQGDTLTKVHVCPKCGVLIGQCPACQEKVKA